MISNNEDDDDELDEEFLNYLSGNVSSPPVRPPPTMAAPSLPSTSTPIIGNGVNAPIANVAPIGDRVGILATSPWALLDMAEAYSASGSNEFRRPTALDVEIGEVGGLRSSLSSSDAPPTLLTSTSSVPPPARAPPPPPHSKAEEDIMDVATPPANHDELFPRPSAPPLELLVENGYFDDDSSAPSTTPASIRPPANDAPPPPENAAVGTRSTKIAASYDNPTAASAVFIPLPSTHSREADTRGRASWMMMPPAEATAVAVTPLGDAVPPMEDPPPDREGGNARIEGVIGSLACLWVGRGNHKRIGLVSLGLMTVLAAIIAVMVMKLGPDPKPIDVTTSTPTASLTIAIWKQQGVSIVGYAPGDNLGTSVAFSADASTIVIGAKGSIDNDPKTGHVKVYRSNDDSGNRVQLGQTIYGNATGDLTGFSVDITADGNAIVIGSPGYWENNDRPGYVRVFALESKDDTSTNTWKQIGGDIIGEVDGDEFGYSVSISEDGNTIVVGARAADGNNGDNLGRVRVYRMDESESDWIQVGDDIKGVVPDDNTGCSVSLSADGTQVAIGSPGFDDKGDASGCVKVYQMDSAGSIWEQLGQTLYGDNARDYSGISVDFSPDGYTLVIGFPGDNADGDRPGYVRVFSLNVSDDNTGTSSWEQIGLDIIGEAKGDEFGSSVSISEDGKTIAVVANTNDGENGVDTGHVRVYRIDDSKSDWIQIGDDIDGEAAYDYSMSVSLSADGNKVAIGSPLNNDNGKNTGHVRVFALEFEQDNTSVTTSSSTMTPTIYIWKQDGQSIVGDAPEDLSGISVAVSADASTIVIGAMGYYDNHSKTGYVKVYYTSDDRGKRLQLGKTIYGDATEDQFGLSVDITASGNTIVIGSPGSWNNKDRPGYVRVFSLETDGDLGTNTWKQIGRDITGEEDGDKFGGSVSISEDGETIAVGADGYDGENGLDSGLVRVYRMDESESDWKQLGDDIEGETAYDWLGFSVSLSADGTRVAIGSAWNGDKGVSSGLVKVYQMDSAGSIWEQLGQTLYGDFTLDYSGMSVSLSSDGNTLAIGSPGDNEDGDRPGYVRVFSLNVSDDSTGTSSWEQIGLDIIGEAKGDEFGRSISLSEDGKTIAIGAVFNEGENGVDTGHARVYRIDDSKSDWIQIGNDIDGEAAYDVSGGSVSLSANGNKVAIGSPLNNDNGENAGHTRVYVLE
ncbi:hypothetical protein ACHAXA_002723 [Cyclostephanos tholiformis]|uniref:Uncharacterized protein n=1 Tax=Cyclostephanos tholiformis TaxID=382380 RepID=A0ABD3REX6_9STRA